MESESILKVNLVQWVEYEQRPAKWRAMGIYDRDYYRGSSRQFFGGGTGRILWTLLWINIVIYVIQIVSGARGGLTDLLSLDPDKVLGHFQIWRLLTYGFCHSPGDVLHIVFNMLFLFWFGTELERMYGEKEFLRFYLTAIVVSGLVFLGLAAILRDGRPSIGASGAVMAVLVLYAIYYPRRTILVFFVFPVEVRWIVIAYLIFDLHPVLLALGGAPQRDGVAHAAHLGGLLYGYLYYHFDLRFSRMFSGFRVVWPSTEDAEEPRKQREYSQAEPSQPPQTDLAKQVDAILEKISAQGEASLNDEERQVLIEASKRFRDRRGR